MSVTLTHLLLFPLCPTVQRKRHREFKRSLLPQIGALLKGTLTTGSFVCPISCYMWFLQKNAEDENIISVITRKEVIISMLTCSNISQALMHRYVWWSVLRRLTICVFWTIFYDNKHVSSAHLNGKMWANMSSCETWKAVATFRQFQESH